MKTLLALTVLAAATHAGTTVTGKFQGTWLAVDNRQHYGCFNGKATTSYSLENLWYDFGVSDNYYDFPWGTFTGGDLTHKIFATLHFKVNDGQLGSGFDATVSLWELKRDDTTGKFTWQGNFVASEGTGRFYALGGSGTCQGTGTYDNRNQTYQELLGRAIPSDFWVDGSFTVTMGFQFD